MSPHHITLDKGKWTTLDYVKALSNVNAQRLSASLGFQVQPGLLSSVYMHTINRDRRLVEYITRDGLQAVYSTFENMCVTANFRTGLKSYQSSVSADVYFRNFLNRGFGGCYPSTSCYH